MIDTILYKDFSMLIEVVNNILKLDKHKRVDSIIAYNIVKIKECCKAFTNLSKLENADTEAIL